MALASLPRRTRQRLRTRDRIFAAAVSEFRRVGVAGSEIEDIVRRARVARGTFYLHFPSKDHVLMELIRRRQGGLVAHLEGRVSQPPASLLGRLVERMADDACGEDRELWAEISAVIVRHPTEMRSATSPLVRLLVAYFEGAQARGEVRHDLPAPDLTAAFLPAVYGLLQARLDGPRVRLRPALHRIVDVFVRGIAAS